MGVSMEFIQSKDNKMIKRIISLRQRKNRQKNAPYGAPQRAVCGFEAVFRLTHTVNQAVIHHDQYSTAGEHGKRELKVSEKIFGSNFWSDRES